MFSTIFCETLENAIQEPHLKKEDNFGIKLYKIELLKYHDLAISLMTLLSFEECVRANRYHFLKDKNRFIICRALLKLLLAEYIGISNDSIIINTDSNKKPFLPPHPSVFFNVSHAGDYAIIAIAKIPLGVDVEHINDKFEYREVVSNVFNKIEIDEIENSLDKPYAFYKLWTRKEAIVKAIGKGIDDDLINIPVTDGIHIVPLSFLCEFKKINVFSFNLNDNYIGALALTEDILDDKTIVFYPLPSLEELKTLFFKNNNNHNSY